MKKVLILVLSADLPPYDKMIETSKNTWDSISIDNCQTIYYCSSFEKQNKDNVIYFQIEEGFLNMGYKTLAGLQWGLENKEFDYIARVHSSTYVDKRKLMEYIQQLPESNIFSGIIADSQNGFKYVWGGGHYIISKDVVKKIVDNNDKWQHKYMEDESMSLLVRELGIAFTDGKSGSIDKMGDNEWRCITYGGETISFSDFSDIKKLNNHFYRVKHDGDRSVDELVMNKLFQTLK
jgi:hypothetical protein